MLTKLESWWGVNFPGTLRNKRKTILYFCLPASLDYKKTGGASTSEANRAIPSIQINRHPNSPSYVYDRRFSEALSKKHDLLVAFFTGSEHRNSIGKTPWPKARFIPIRDFPSPKRLPLFLAWPLQTATRVVRIALLVRVLRPDLVYGNWITRLSGLYCAFVGFHPFLVNAWGTDLQIEAKKSGLLRMFAKFTIGRADSVIVDCEVQRKDLLELGCDPRKIYCFPWGIDLTKFKPRESTAMRRKLGWLNKKIVLSTRMQIARCGVEYLIRAIPGILEKEKEARFLIVGNGPLLDYHKSLARKLGIEDKVKFLGWIPNEEVPRILSAADVYVSTSFSDGTSASLLEAMACGLPVVVARIPANEEWVTEGKNGHLVPPGDSGELAECVARVLVDGKLRSRMRKASLEITKERADWKLNSLILQSCVSDLIASRVSKQSVQMESVHHK